MDFTNDLAIFFADLGVSATISEAEKDDQTATVLFDKNSMDAAGMVTDKPQVTIQTADLAGFTRSKCTITVDGTAYGLINPLDDGQGLTIAGLKRGNG